jgi:carbamoyltransferase
MFTLGYTGFTRDTRLAPGIRSPLAKTHQNFDTIFEFREGEVPFSLFPLGYFGHDASAALLSDGKVIACAAEERFTRVKYSLNLAGNTLLPHNAVAYCLREAGISIRDVDVVAHYCNFTPEVVARRCGLLKPFCSADDAARVESSYQQVFRNMMAPDVVRGQFERMTGAAPRTFLPVRHHDAHAASAYFPSGFDQALILTIDGTGELESSLLAVGRGKEITERGFSLLPTSLGALYLIITVYLGFKSLGDEYKVMGLASYGAPSRFRDVFEELVHLDDGGVYSTPELAAAGLKERLLAKLGPSRDSRAPFEARHADVAAALQEALHRAVLHTLRHARTETGIPRLCMAGGVALNCTLNGVIARSGLFDQIFVQPASSDEGCSAGAAFYASARAGKLGDAEKLRWEHAYWGPAYTDSDMLTALEKRKAELQWERSGNIATTVAEKLAAGKVVGWFQGRMEFGPRALGNRSILADPRDAGMKDRINATVKKREPFRPFAPAVIEEDAHEYFDMTGLRSSPFMLFTVPVREEKKRVIPAVTHVDGTARIQTVSRKTNPRFADLLEEFRNRTGVPVLLNTSFNVKNEPIVCTPTDALRCFLSTDIDVVALGDFFVQKRNAP